ncbi:MAG: AI-2E family transporter, partial [Dongiaceae bacterium]
MNEVRAKQQPEPSVGLALEADAPVATEKPLPSDPRTIFLGGLFLLALLATLYVARPIILPIVLAVVLKFLLQPLIRVADRFHVPRLLAAGGAVALLIGYLAAVGAALSGPASSWLNKLPDGMARLEEKLQFLREPFGFLSRINTAINHVLSGGDAYQATSPATTGAAQHASLSDSLLAGTGAILDGSFTTLLLLFFLLAAGDTFLRRLVEILPRFSDKRQAVDISQQIERDISSYLLTISAMNLAVGIAVGIAMYCCGLGDPILWGVVALLLNYVPILGPVMGVCLFALIGLLTFDHLVSALVPAVIY